MQRGILGFHTIALSLVDFDFAQEQLLLLLRTLYAHPNGQIPAYKWNFSDENPPVHTWATLFFNVRHYVFMYSALACFKTGMSGSASVQWTKKFW
jgi:hypothetical protein